LKQTGFDTLSKWFEIIKFNEEVKREFLIVDAAISDE